MSREVLYRRDKEEKNPADDKGEHGRGVCILIGLLRNRSYNHMCVIQVPTSV